MPNISRAGNFEYIDWKVAMEHYLWDRLIEAHEVALGIGIGATGAYIPRYRMIEAEWLTRTGGHIETVNDWLQVEFIYDETGVVENLGSSIADICEETAESFGIEERPEILVTVLSAESDAPWVDSRAGYFIDKYPYDKICIPNRAVFAPAELHEVVSHEYSHALNLVLTQAKCPLWLNEGIAMLAQPKLDPQIQNDFASARAPWKNPHRLDAAFHAEIEGQRDYVSIHRAYEQAGWIVRYLLHLSDRLKIAELMRAFNDNSFLTEFKMRLISEDAAEEALRQVFGFGEAQLFEQAREWMSRQPS
jgi:hypothetical protein